jgi:hypothetical protein
VKAVVEIDVCVTGRAIERLVAASRSWRGMAGGVGLADVRLDFDDGSAGSNMSPTVNEDLPEKIGGHLQCPPFIELTRQLHTVQQLTDGFA